MIRTPLTPRQEAEAIEQFGDDLIALNKRLDTICEQLSRDVLERVNAIPNQDRLGRIARDFQDLALCLTRECDAAEEAEERRQMISVGGHRDGGSAA